jgi:hypothetical protein
MLAVWSAFLEPPADEISPMKAPGPAEQQAMLDRAEAYTLNYLKVLPNLVCTEVVHRFDDDALPEIGPGASHRAEFALRDVVTAELTIRNGAEWSELRAVSEVAPGRMRMPLGTESELRKNMTTSGELGSVLSGVFATRENHLRWRRWETLTGRSVAVFGYSIAKSDSRFRLFWSSSLTVKERQSMNVITAYRGEFAIDPASGAILRATQQAVQVPDYFPLRRSDLLVEYRPTKVAKNWWLLPARSLAVIEEWDPNAGTATDTRSFEDQTWQMGALKRYANTAEYSDYRKFESESNLVLGDLPAAERLHPSLQPFFAPGQPLSPR